MKDADEAAVAVVFGGELPGKTAMARPGWPTVVMLLRSRRYCRSRAATARGHGMAALKRLIATN